MPESLRYRRPLFGGGWEGEVNPFLLCGAGGFIPPQPFPFGESPERGRPLSDWSIGKATPHILGIPTSLGGSVVTYVAIYCRLSREDKEAKDESESIQNQKQLLLRYAKENGWNVYKIYVDEDYSGADSGRPAFSQLLQDAERRLFSAVLCKTQSRFTRNIEDVERYIHGRFLELGIRFIAPLDNIDTAVRGNKKQRQLSGLINEWYLEDLSENIKTVFDLKRRNGQFIGSFPPFGYQKDPGDHNKLVVDPEAAGVVELIFRLYLRGYSPQQIADHLNAEGVPNPTDYKRLQGSPYQNGRQKYEGAGWNRTSIRRILQNQTYAGNMVQGKRQKASYKSKVLLSVPEDRWIIVKNTHPPIVSKSLFTRAQKLQALSARGGKDKEE